MECSVDQQITRISNRIRQWREEDSLTLQELAERGGLATSTVQKVETGQMMPSLAVLLKVARGLGRHVAELLEDEDNKVDVFHRKHAASNGARLTVECVSGNLPKAALETWQVSLEPGVSSGCDQIQYDGEEVVVCETGTVTFRIGEQEYELTPGDSIHFRGSLPHSWYNHGTEPARFTITGTLPLIFRGLLQTRVPRATPCIDEQAPPISLVG